MSSGYTECVRADTGIRYMAVARDNDGTTHHLFHHSEASP